MKLRFHYTRHPAARVCRWFTVARFGAAIRFPGSRLLVITWGMR